MNRDFSGQWTRVSGTVAGTSVVKPFPCILGRVVVPTQKTGTISLYDCSTAAGTTSTNFIMDIQNTTGTIPNSVEIGATMRYGITAVVGGTTDIVVVHS